MQRSILLTFVFALAGCLHPRAPFDPRPLMERLSDKNADEMHFLVFGDSKSTRHFPGVLKFADGLNPDFCLTTADLVSRGAGRESGGSYRKLKKQAGWFLDKYPTWPTIGNHELSATKKEQQAAKRKEGGKKALREQGRENYRDFFGIQESEYSFVHGNAKFIALGWEKIKENPKKLDWLERELESGKGRHLFVFLHRPYYTVGKKKYSDVEGKSTVVTRLFEKHGVVAVFSGHDHIYYRTNRGGVHHVISAGAGAGIYPLNREKDAIAGDVYYGRRRAEEGRGYRFHFGDGRPDEIFDEAVYYVVSVKVSGETVTLRMRDAKDGRVWDEAVLRR